MTCVYYVKSKIIFHVKQDPEPDPLQNYWVELDPDIKMKRIISPALRTVHILFSNLFDKKISGDNKARPEH